MSAGLRVAVAATGALCAAGRGVDALWSAFVTPVPTGGPVSRYPVLAQGFESAVLLPDALFEAVRVRAGDDDPSVGAALLAIDEACEGWRIPAGTGLWLGTSLGCMSRWRDAHAASVAGATGVSFAQTGHGDTAPRVAARLGLDGPCVTVSTACTSSAAALLEAARAVTSGRVPAAIVVGVDLLGPFVHHGFAALGALSPADALPSPFSSNRCGTWLGEGAGALVLVPSSGHGVHVAGGAVRSDAHHMTSPEPSGEGLVRAIEAALERARLHASDVGWISAHATGTPANDRAEAIAFARAFGGSIPPVHLAKPVLGHTLGACGALEIALAVEVLRRRRRPASLPLGPADPTLPALPIDTTVTPFAARAVLSVNAAFAGHNTAVVLEDA